MQVVKLLLSIGGFLLPSTLLTSCTSREATLEELEQLHQTMKQNRRMTPEQKAEYLEQLSDIDTRLARYEYDPPQHRRIRVLLRECYGFMSP